MVCIWRISYRGIKCPDKETQQLQQQLPPRAHGYNDKHSKMLKCSLLQLTLYPVEVGVVLGLGNTANVGIYQVQSEYRASIADIETTTNTFYFNCHDQMPW